VQLTKLNVFCAEVTGNNYQNAFVNNTGLMMEYLNNVSHACLNAIIVLVQRIVQLVKVIEFNLQFVHVLLECLMIIFQISVKLVYLNAQSA